MHGCWLPHHRSVTRRSCHHSYQIYTHSDALVLIPVHALHAAFKRVDHLTFLVRLASVTVSTEPTPVLSFSTLQVLSSGSHAPASSAPSEVASNCSFKILSFSFNSGKTTSPSDLMCNLVDLILILKRGCVI